MLKNGYKWVKKYVNRSHNICNSLMKNNKSYAREGNSVSKQYKTDIKSKQKSI